MKKLFLIVLILPLSMIAFAIQVVEQPELSPVQWLAKNWEIIALIVSELMAFLPAKWTGIVKTLIAVLGRIIGLFSSISLKSAKK